MSTSTSNSHYNAPTDFRISQNPPDEIPEAYRAAFTQIYSAIQQLILTLVTNCGIGPRDVSQWLQLSGNVTTLLAGNLNRLYVPVSENIVYGAALNLYAGGGGLTARLANATNATKPAHGFCSTPGGIAIGTTGEMQLHVGTVQIAGLTPGLSYYLSTTDGLITNSPPVAAGNIEEYVGVAVSSTVLAFNTGAWLQH